MDKNPAHSMIELFPLFNEIPPEFCLDSGGWKAGCLLDGRVCPWEGKHTDVTSPICIREDDILGRPVIGRMPSMDESAAMAALEAAYRAWDKGRGKWPAMRTRARIEAVEAFVIRLQQLRSEVVKLLMWEIGKSLDDSRKEFDRTIEYINHTVAVLKKRDDSRLSLGGGAIARVGLSPLGVCLIMGPFNNPLYETYSLLIPALITGNTTVVKSPKFGVLIHQLLQKALADIFPPGAVNFIYGNGKNGTDNVVPLIKSGKIDALAYTGSSVWAENLLRRHPRPLRLRSLLGLSAKNPALIMGDANIDLAVEECLSGALDFNGQKCTALKILFVHESIVEPFLERLCRAVNSLPMGMPWVKGVKTTPLPECDKTRIMKGYIEDAVAKGGRVVNDGGGTVRETLFFPAVVYPVSPLAELYWKEQFGPVVPVCSYRDEEEFLDFVARSDYAQQVSIFGGNIDQIHNLVDCLANQTCRINLNCRCRRNPDTFPFAGRKDSGNGVLSIDETLSFFAVPSLIAAPSNQENYRIIRQILQGPGLNSLSYNEFGLSGELL